MKAKDVRGCSECGHHLSIVTDSRRGRHGFWYRRRECAECKHRWSTFEMREQDVKDAEEVLLLIKDHERVEKIREVLHDDVTPPGRRPEPP